MSHPRSLDPYRQEALLAEVASLIHAFAPADAPEAVPEAPGSSVLTPATSRSPRRTRSVCPMAPRLRTCSSIRPGRARSRCGVIE